MPRGRDEKMPKLKNRKIVLASRPFGEPTEDNFRLIETEEPDQPDGGLLLKSSGSRSTPICGAS